MSVIVNKQTSGKKMPFPEDLEKGINVVLMETNNIFQKLILLELNRGPASIVQLRGRIEKRIEKSERVYLAQKEAFSYYLRNRLCTYGLVTEDATERPAYFSLTSPGKIYAVPISMFMLNYEFKKKKSLIEILGTAPFNRIRILEELRKKNQSLRNLATKLNVTDRGLMEQLKNLGEINFIKYESCGDVAEGGGEPFNYTWIQGRKASDVKIVGGYTLLTAKVAQCLEGSGKLDAHQIAEKIGSSVGSISMVLSGLYRQGFAQRGRWKVGKVLSNVSLLENGAGFLNEFSDKIGLALNDHPILNKMQMLFEEIIEDGQRLENIYTNSLKLYIEFSPSQNKTPLKNNLKKIMEYVQNNPGSRAGDILEKLGLPSSGSAYLTVAVKEGVDGVKLTKEGTGKKTRYYVSKKQ